jgi:hypothetical protein
MTGRGLGLGALWRASVSFFFTESFAFGCFNLRFHAECQNVRNDFQSIGSLDDSLRDRGDCGARAIACRHFLFVDWQLQPAVGGKLALLRTRRELRSLSIWRFSGSVSSGPPCRTVFNLCGGSFARFSGANGGQHYVPGFFKCFLRSHRRVHVHSSDSDPQEHVEGIGRLERSAPFENLLP